jgi:pimeloyl-ACP methyl ester carboxylesterase
MTSHHTVANAGEALRKAGYRAVLVDMRGFGESTGAHTDFGVTDARDLKQLVDVLQAKGLCGKTVGVYGTSMGAATAILLAAEDARVVTVVAVAPFADIRTEVPSYARGVLGALAATVPDEELNEAANVVGAVAQWDLDQARPIEAIRKTRASILLIHGDADEFIPHAASEQLHAAALDHSTLVTMPGRGHLDVCFDIPGELQGMTREWFDKKLMPH